MEELILKNCTIHDNGELTLCDILIRNGLIEKIDTTLSLDGKFVTDCCGNLVLPGFIDSHLHIPGHMLYEACGICLDECQTVPEYIAMLNEYKNRFPKGKAVLGFGWWDDIIYKSDEYINDTNFAKLIDDIFPDNPVILYSADFHSAWCNTPALDRMNITKDTTPPVNGIIERTKNGELSGFLRGKATNSIKEKEEVFSFSEADFEVAFKKYQDLLLSYGITTVQTLMFIGISAEKAWSVLKRLEENNELIININGYVPAEPDDEPADLLNRYFKMQSLSSKKIKINTVKIYIDGVVENQTAYLKSPYSNNTSNCGLLYWEPEKLNRLCSLLEENSIQIHAHTIGDAATSVILKALNYAQKNHGNNNCRHILAHLQVIDQNDLALFKETNAIACVQPFWINGNLNDTSLDSILLGDRAKDEYPIRSFIENGIRLISSSDSPVTEKPLPFIAIHNAVNRTHAEKADLDDMIQSYTSHSAFALMRETEIGRIKPGMIADLVVTSENLYLIPESDIGKTKCLLTIVDGKIIYNNL